MLWVVPWCVCTKNDDWLADDYTKGSPLGNTENETKEMKR